MHMFTTQLFGTFCNSQPILIKTNSELLPGLSLRGGESKGRPASVLPGRALGLVPAGSHSERVAVRLLPVALPAGLTLLGLKEVCKVSFTR